MIPDPREEQAKKDELRQIAHVRDDLAHEFSTLPAALIDEQVSRRLETFHSAKVRSFVPVLVRRGAREQLKQLI